MSQKARFIHRFRLERLERRDLLCSTMASQAAAAAAHAAAQAAPFAQAHTAKAAADSGSSAADESSETHLFATLTNSTGVVVGTAFYETEVHGTRQRKNFSSTLWAARRMPATRSPAGQRISERSPPMPMGTGVCF